MGMSYMYDATVRTVQCQVREWGARRRDQSGHECAQRALELSISSRLSSHLGPRVGRRVRRPSRASPRRYCTPIAVVL